MGAGGVVGSIVDLPEDEDVPPERGAERARAHRASHEGRVKGFNGVLDTGCFLVEVKGLIDLGHWTDTEDVDDGSKAEPQEPGSCASMRCDGLLGPGLVFGLGLVLADGLYHDWSLRLSGVFAKGIWER